ncbi:DUF4190 domain-containing protein [Nocardioides sp. KIGAM211]|uniref:DUF4190 domain-containing protein n=1 Tax=Nocardioides luti TaxID=2761101 RepID=A0A7X0RFE0_9ACTN|nr:DUF4190 domain-containing protein [Nocardioides luti]MBB6627301.1 DUF4190 domain-containing protein [Nocardioides luti]
MTTSDSGDQNPSDGSMPPTHQPYGQQPPTNPYGPPPVPPTQNPYGEAPPQQNPYGQGAPSPYGTPAPPPYGQPQGYPQPGQAPGYGYGQPVAANHPSATTALVLSLIGLAGILFCGGITLVLSPFAWRIGAKAVREIDASPGQYAGRDQANAGKIMGLIGTVLIGILLAIGLVALVAVGAGSSTSP